MRPYIESAVLNLTGDRATVLAGGIQTFIRDELNVEVPILKLKKATNRFLSQTESTGGSVGFNFATMTPTASYSEGESDSTQVTHQYAEIQMGENGVVNFGNLTQLELDGAVINTSQATGNIGQVTLISPQDTAQSSSSGFNVGVSGVTDVLTAALEGGSIGDAIKQADPLINQLSGLANIELISCTSQVSFSGNFIEQS